MENVDYLFMVKVMSCLNCVDLKIADHRTCKFDRRFVFFLFLFAELAYVIVILTYSNIAIEFACACPIVCLSFNRTDCKWIV